MGMNCSCGSLEKIICNLPKVSENFRRFQKGENDGKSDAERVYPDE